MIAIVVAAAENSVIGKNNEIPWHLPADLRYFKQVTMGHPIIMGRKTFESIGKPLPGRTSIIITTQQDYKAEGCIVTHSLEEAIKRAKELDEQISIIGGAKVYEQALSLALVDVIHLTKVHATLEGDTFFPELEEEAWEVVSEEHHDSDEKNKYSYTFLKLHRK